MISNSEISATLEKFRVATQPLRAAQRELATARSAGDHHEKHIADLHLAKHHDATARAKIATAQAENAPCQRAIARLQDRCQHLSSGEAVEIADEAGLLCAQLMGALEETRLAGIAAVLRPVMRDEARALKLAQESDSYKAFRSKRQLLQAAYRSGEHHWFFAAKLDEIEAILSAALEGGSALETLLRFDSGEQPAAPAAPAPARPAHETKHSDTPTAATPPASGGEHPAKQPAPAASAGKP